MSQPGLPVQQDAVRRLDACLLLTVQQQPPLRQYSSLMQPHAAAVAAPAGKGTPNAVSKYATSVRPAQSRRRSERQNDCRRSQRMGQLTTRGANRTRRYHMRLRRKPASAGMQNPLAAHPATA
jgi:hypothetical protein